MRSPFSLSNKVPCYEEDCKKNGEYYDYDKYVYFCKKHSHKHTVKLFRLAMKGVRKTIHIDVLLGTGEKKSRLR